MRLFRYPRALVPSLFGLLAVLGLSATAYAVSQSLTTPTTVIRACAQRNGLLRLVGPQTQCRAKETLVTWNVVGPQGPAGANGNTVLNGTGAPASALGTVGDFYLNTATETMYGPKTTSGWASSGTSLVGSTGQTGPQGQAGTNGNTILNGVGAPASSLGAVGDFYLDTDTANEALYGPKTSSGWPSSGTSLIGPAGQTGSAGATGPQGPQGPAGPGISCTDQSALFAATFESPNPYQVQSTCPAVLMGVSPDATVTILPQTPQTFTVVNAGGTGTGSVTGIQIGYGANASSFSPTSCSTTSLAPGQSCSFTVTNQSSATTTVQAFGNAPSGATSVSWNIVP